MYLIFLLAFVVCSFATMGADVSDALAQSDFQCLLNEGYSFAIPRGYQSLGQVDPNVVNNIQNARAAGFQNVDVYLFPCVSCGNPQQQITDLYNAISGQSYGMIWLDIEIYQWSSDQGANQNFISNMIAQGQNLTASLGIYTNLNNWSTIVGADWSGASSLPLWYAHYDGNQSFGDFTPFGGWNTPNIKQYQGDDTQCGYSIDDDWYP